LAKKQGFAILVVEDQPLIALSIEDVIRETGGGVVGSAARLCDALSLIETASWDAALLDVKLAQGEAVYPAAERLQVKGVPFAFLTAWDGEIDARYSDVPVLRKPFSEAELESCLQMLIARGVHRVTRRGVSGTGGQSATGQLGCGSDAGPRPASSSAR
jgi:DNA-binding response OmpR family regulator